MTGRPNQSRPNRIKDNLSKILAHAISTLIPNFCLSLFNFSARNYWTLSKNTLFTALKCSVAATILATLSGLTLAADPHPTTTETQRLTPQDIALTAKAFARQRNISLHEICDALYSEASFYPDITVGLVMPGLATIEDGTFHQGAFEGIEATADCFGIQTKYLQSTIINLETLDDLLSTEDLDIVVTVGHSFSQATAMTANLRPEVWFVGADQTNPDSVPNYIAISAENWQVGYLAGVAAGLLTESNQIGVAAGPALPPVVTIVDGFEAGVASSAPKAIVLSEYLASFNDSTLGAVAAVKFIAKGADVIFGVGGGTGAGAIKAAALADTSVIGVDLDQYYTTFGGGKETGVNRLVTSAIKRINLGLFLSLAALLVDDVTGGELVLDAANGGVTYADFHEYDIPSNIVKQLERAILDLANGTTSIACQ